MTLPRSTYRLQFRNGMDFGKARQRVPHLAQSGISHLHASPVMTVVAGSSRDDAIVDANEIDPALGGLDGLRQLAGDLRAQGLGLILDIAPGHMAARLENPWWHSVVTWGEESPFSRHFDIDWSRKLTLPVLDRDFATELSDGAIRLALDPEHGVLALHYRNGYYPLHPETCQQALAAQDDLLLFTSPMDAFEGSAALAGTLAFAGMQEATRTLAEIAHDPRHLAAVHEAQPWRLVNRATAGRALSYRRGGDDPGLVGLRMEDAPVFDAHHRLVFTLVREGIVNGLRVIGIDALADPRAYLERLRAAIGRDILLAIAQCPGRDEQRIADWPIDGVMGEDAAGSEALDAAKRRILTDTLESERSRLTRQAKAMADQSDADLSHSALAEAICAMIVALPVGRTYVTARTVSDGDRQIIAAARQEAQEGARPEVREALDFIWELLADDRVPDRLADCAEFRARFQQLSSAVMMMARADTRAHP